MVLNLIINGLPSIQNLRGNLYDNKRFSSFKPYYKWITFNTITVSSSLLKSQIDDVLNLIINGLPSIQNGRIRKII